MRQTVTPDEVMAYDQDGFVLLRGVFNAAEVSDWRRAIASASARRRANPPAGRLARLDCNPGPNELFVQHVNLWQTDEAVQGLVLGATVGNLLTSLTAGRPLRLCFDSMLVKRPFGAASRFHLDLPHWSVSTQLAGTMWIALDCTDTTSGCMCYLPGTHLEQRDEDPTVVNGFRALFERHPDWETREPFFCPMSPGDVVVHNASTAHGSTANLRPRPRRAMTVAFASADACFDGTESRLFVVSEPAEPGAVLDPTQHPLLNAG